MPIEAPKRPAARRAIAKLAALRAALRLASGRGDIGTNTLIRLAMGQAFVSRREILADRLADALFALDEARFVARGGPASIASNEASIGSADRVSEFRQFDTKLGRLYEEIDEILRQIAD